MKKGFTLIELLVVIAIIGILATIVTVALGGSRAKARDTRRVSDMKFISTALDLYLQEHGLYPVSAGVVDCDVGTDAWIPGLTGMPEDASPSTCLPPYDSGDASSPSTGYYYASPDGTSYLLVTRLEDSSNSLTLQNSDAKDCNGNVYTSPSSEYYNWLPRAYVINSC